MIGRVRPTNAREHGADEDDRFAERLTCRHPAEEKRRNCGA